MHFIKSLDISQNLNKMLHYWPFNLRVVRKFTGLPPKKARFT